MLTANFVLWMIPGPLLSGIVFGALFAVTYMPFNRWLAKKVGGPYKAIAAVPMTRAQTISLGLSTGAFFGLFMFVKSVAEAAKISDVFWFLVMGWTLLAYLASIPIMRLRAEWEKARAAERQA
ncbi:MAG TPA: hypothetical protein PK264_16565 [Hyphomicrobiaceae bacterium]|nr:hypothetical protein [Hyphomicrobiaceae bacterium]